MDLGSANDCRASGWRSKSSQRLQDLRDRPSCVSTSSPAASNTEPRWICPLKCPSVDYPVCSQQRVISLIYSSVESEGAQSCSKPTEPESSHNRGSTRSTAMYVAFDSTAQPSLMECTCRPALGRLWWEDCKLKASLGYMVNSQSETYQDSGLRNKRRGKEVWKEGERG